MSDVIELVETEVCGEYFNTWAADDMVHLVLGHTTLSMPTHVWEEFSKMVYISEEKRVALNSGDVNKLHAINMDMAKRKDEIENACDCHGEDE